MPRPNAWEDPQGYALYLEVKEEKAASQLDRIEKMLSTLLAEIRVQSRLPRGACTGCIPVARTGLAPAFPPPQPARVGESQTTFPSPRCTGLRGTAPEASES